MRRLADADRVRRLMRALGATTHEETSVYFTGGVSAVLMGWRDTTIDVDLLSIPERDEIYRRIPEMKEDLQINVELASPADFLPELPGWKERSVFITREGAVSFFHYDFHAQALAKIERGHEQDRRDVESMFQASVVTPFRLRELFDAIAPYLYRFPAVDPAAFRRALGDALAAAAEGAD